MHQVLLDQLVAGWCRDTRLPGHGIVVTNFRGRQFRRIWWQVWWPTGAEPSPHLPSVIGNPRDSGARAPMKTWTRIRALKIPR